MDKLNNYRQLVRQILEKYAAIKPAIDNVEMELILDAERDRYQLMTVGWNGYDRYYGSLIHIDIKNEQIWIQHDGTENGIADELVTLGVPKEDIVLAFHAPYKRPYTGFGTGLSQQPQAELRV